MDETPKLAKDPSLLGPKKAKNVAPLAKALLLGSSVLVGFGIIQGTPSGPVNPTDAPSISTSATLTPQVTNPAPLVLKPAGDATPLLAQHRSHSSHSSHSSHRSHSSHHSSSF
jgi:hypothetical protein